MGRRLLAFALGLAVTAGACAQETGPSTTPPDYPSAPASPPIEGVLTDEGAECPAMRGADGKLYTLMGDLGGFTVGDRVCLVPSDVEISFCMQGSTVQVDWIGPAPCPPG